MNSRVKKLVSLVCTAAMLVSALPMSALAAEGEHDHGAEGCAYVNGAYVCNPDAALKGEIATLQAATFQAARDSASTIYKKGGWLESAYIEWTIAPGVQKYEVDVKEKNASTWTKLDNELVREYPGYMRADALGLKAGTYQMRVIPDGKEADALVSDDLTVVAHDRSGWAFEAGKAPGAYEMDGTLKAGAIVVYITNETKDTVTVNLNLEGKGETPVTGLQNLVLAYKKSSNKVPPMAIRLIGNIDVPSNNLKGDIQSDTGKNACYMTIEGVGNDAVANGWGFTMKNTSYLELRNLAFMNCHSEEGDNIGLQQTDDHVWVHNCDSFYGDAGSDADQIKGDGALDTKKSQYITHSYNHFWDNGKCNLQGANASDTSNYITYHHNWYDHSDSRHPRVRCATVHVYNNYYDGNAKYGIGSTTDSDIFAENNYFRKCNYPMMISKQGTDAKGGGTFSGEAGGMIKAYGNTIESASSFIPYTSGSTDFDAYVAASRDEKVPDTVKAVTGAGYNNFDTDTSNYVGKKDYKLDTAAEARANVMKYAGRVEGGDFKWTFNNDIEDTNYNVIPALKDAVKSYETTLVSVGGFVKNSSSEHTEHTYGPYTVKTPASCTANGVEERTCLFPGCGHTDTRVIPGGHKYVNGVCSACGNKEPAGGGGDPGPSGGTIKKELRASDFKMTPLDASTGKHSDFVEGELAKVTDYFTMFGTVRKRTKEKTSEGSTVEYFDLSKSSDNGFTFTVKAENAPATLTARFSSTGSSSTSALVLEDSTGTKMAVKGGTATFTTVTGTAKQAKEATYELQAGTYTIKGSTDGGAASDARLYSATVSETTSETEHQYGAWTVVRAATCGKDGLEEQVCSKCGTKNSRTIPATENHTWDDGVADENGDKVYTCTVCGRTETRPSGEEPTPPSTVDKTDLTAIITKANAALNGVTESDDAAKVPMGTYWALKADIDAFKAAIAAAQTVADKTDATTDDVSKAIDDLAAAMGEFADALKEGTKPAGGTTTPTVHTFESKTLPEAAKNSTEANTTKPYAEDNYFTLAPGVNKTKYDGSNKEWKAEDFGDNAYDPSGDHAVSKVIRFNMGGKTTATGPAIKFITTSDNAKVQIWWVQNGGDVKNDDNTWTEGKPYQIALLKEDASKVATSELAHAGATAGGEGRIKKNDPEYTELTAPTAGTYMVGSLDGSNYIFKIVVTETSGGSETPPTVDKSALTEAIKKAEEKLASATEDSVDGKDVDPSKKWATKESKKRFAAEIAAAKLAAKIATTDAAVTEAVNALKAASDAFIVQSGTKTETPDNPGGGGGGGGSSSGGGGGGGGGSTTKKPTDKIDNTTITMDSSTTAGHVAEVELTDSQAKTLTSNAVKSGSDEIVVSVNAPKSAAGVSLNVSGSALKNMADKTDAALALQSPVGNARLPHAAVAGLGGGKDVSFTIARTDNGMKVTVTAGDKTLDKIAGGVTVVTNASGNGTVAYLLTANGEGLLKKSYVDNGKLYASLPGSGEIVLKDNAKTFRDIDDSWAKSAIDFATSRELFNGVNGLDFAPNQEMTRSMLVTVLYRLEGAKSSAANKFADVAADSWYAEAVAWGNAEGIVSGKSATHFGPNDDITREQLATILYRYATKLCGMGEIAEDSKALEKFSDAATVSGFAEDGMAWCVEQGIIGGRGDGTLAPGGFASRAEVATMLMRFIKAIV